MSAQRWVVCTHCGARRISTAQVRRVRCRGCGAWMIAWDWPWPPPAIGDRVRITAAHAQDVGARLNDRERVGVLRSLSREYSSERILGWVQWAGDEDAQSIALEAIEPEGA